MIGSYIQPGDNLNYVNATETVIAAGSLVVMGEVTGVAATTIEPSETGVIATRGVFEFEKDGTDITAGAAVYYDTENEKATANADNGLSGGSKKYHKIGLAAAAAETSSGTVAIKIG